MFGEGPPRQQMFKTSELNSMFHEDNDVVMEETWKAEPTGSRCYELWRGLCISQSDERPNKLCSLFCYREAEKNSESKATDMASLHELGLPFEGGSIKLVKSGHAVVTRGKALTAETLVIDLRCIEHIELLSATDLHASNNNLCWCCCLPFCGRFPELRDRVRLLASDEIDRVKCRCGKMWCNCLPCCFGGAEWKQVIVEFQVAPGTGANFADQIRKMQEDIKGGKDGRCFKVLEINDIQGRFVTKGIIKVLSPEGSVCLPEGAVLIKDPEELLMMDDKKLNEFIKSRGATVLSNVPLLMQAQRLYNSQQCDRYVEEEFPRSQSCFACNCCPRKNCYCFQMRPFFQCNRPLNGARRDWYYKTETK